MTRDQFVSKMARECRCGCFECGDRPCDSLLAGGFCDRRQCKCDDEDRYDDIDRLDDDTDGAAP